MPTFLPVVRNERYVGSASNTTRPGHAPRIHRYGSGRWRWSWDESLRLLSVADAGRHIAALPLDSLDVCAAAMASLDEGVVAALIDALCDLTNLLDRWDGTPPWPSTVRDALGHLLLFILAVTPGPEGHELQETAAAVVRRLTTDTPDAAWYVAFQAELPFTHRAGVLAAAAEANAFALPDVRWWTAQQRLNVAIEWARSGFDEAEALAELSAAAAAYMQLLQTEPSRRAVETFYAAFGTTSEREVLRAHRAREEYGRVDDVERADLMSWLLRRYSLYDAWRLLRGSLRPREIAGATAAAALTIAGLVLFVQQTSLRAQTILQMAGFSCLVFFAPRLFAWLLPRALFGSLLAWTTVILVQSASLLPIVSADATVRNACHTWLRRVAAPDEVARWLTGVRAGHALSDWPPLLDFVAIVAACLGLVVVFLMIEVGTRLATRQFGRSLFCVVVMLGGSLFWGAMLVPMLQYIVGRDSHGAHCRCLYPSWLLGSVCAVAIGILVQLMWDDRAVSEPFGTSGVSKPRPA